MKILKRMILNLKISQKIIKRRLLRIVVNKFKNQLNFGNNFSQNLLKNMIDYQKIVTNTKDIILVENYHILNRKKHLNVKNFINGLIKIIMIYYNKHIKII